LNRLDKKGVSPLHLAAALGYADTLKELISANADFTQQDAKRGWTALHFASYQNSKPAVAALVAAMSESQVRIGTKRFEQSALMVAAHFGCICSLEALLQDTAHKSDVVQRDACGDYALHYAVRSGHLQSTKMLLANTSKLEHYQIENGIGLTVLDFGKQVATQHLYRSGNAVPTNRREIYEYVLGINTSQSERERETVCVCVLICSRGVWYGLFV
jgi:ankyrin repeat protein